MTDPNKRISISDLRKHPWFKLHQPETPNFDHSSNKAVNEKLVYKMEASLGFSPDSVRHAVMNNKHNHLSATYYLLLKKYAQINYKQSFKGQSRLASSALSTSHGVPGEERTSTVSNSDAKKRAESTNAHTEFADASSSVKYNKMRARKINDL